LHLITGLNVGGTEKTLLRTLPLLNNNFDNRVCCIIGRGIIGEELLKKGVTVDYLDFKNIFDLGVIFRFKGVIDSFQPDLLVTYLIHADLFGRIFGKLFGIKNVVCSERGSLLNWEWMRVVDKWTSFLVDKYIVQTEVAKNKLSRQLGLPIDKFIVIPNVVDLKEDEFKLNIKGKKIKLGLNVTNINMICVGNLRIGKGHKFLLEAFENVFKTNKNVNLLIVGDGDQKDSLINQIKKYHSKDNIYFLGQRNDVKELLKISDIFVLATEAEGMSNAILEAMASGLPVITTDILENKELIKNGKTGLLVSVKSIDGFISSLNKLIRDEQMRNMLGKNAYKQILNKYSVDKVIMKLKLFFNCV